MRKAYPSLIVGIVALLALSLLHPTLTGRFDLPVVKVREDVIACEDVNGEQVCEISQSSQFPWLQQPAYYIGSALLGLVVFGCAWYALLRLRKTLLTRHHRLEQLAYYVKKCKKAGFSEDKIREYCRTMRYRDKDINRALL